MPDVDTPTRPTPDTASGRGSQPRGPRPSFSVRWGTGWPGTGGGCWASGSCSWSRPPLAYPHLTVEPVRPRLQRDRLGLRRGHGADRDGLHGGRRRAGRDRLRLGHAEGHRSRVPGRRGPRGEGREGPARRRRPGQPVPIPTRRARSPRTRHAAFATPGPERDDRERADRSADLQDVVASAVGSAPVEAYLTGYSQSANDLTEVENADVERAESIGIPIALIVLVLALAAVIAGFIPLITALVSLTFTFGLLSLLIIWRPIDSFLLSIVTMIGVGISIDYSLFILTPVPRGARQGTRRGPSRTGRDRRRHRDADQRPDDHLLRHDRHDLAVLAVHGEVAALHRDGARSRARRDLHAVHRVDDAARLAGGARRPREPAVAAQAVPAGDGPRGRGRTRPAAGPGGPAPSSSTRGWRSPRPPSSSCSPCPCSA